ncbi:GMC family oxidoreductase [filamentous cyanobacterium LEGE 11480]|uniref:GMC family oxidoreductase n=1 Tax=Romeriopsis navalis LEGE 11480 TaxID=2777977 RepID=A0A928Z2U6_9CYAN|nr:GMC family oxidoreductase [Romeriopsis navalis]MBE9028715.1 GMC family oxidoreductase [Romeriopsis navalis LEGE 11480]
MAEHYDIIIIGTGAGGGTLAHRLAPSGKKILVLERGDFLPRERENWDSHEVFVNRRYAADDTWYDSQNQPFKPGTHYYVGGNTKFYGAALFRLRESDFGEVKHVDGISPAWPLSYNDFEPYYSEAETLYHVHGQRGQDPTEPPSATPYPYQPVPHEPRIQTLNDDLEKLGFQPFYLPLGVRLADDPAYPQAPVCLSYFDGFPDPTESKADAHVIAMKPALTHPNLTLLTQRYVERLETSSSGNRVDRVIVDHNGAEESYTGNIVVCACGAVNSAALLLRSANDQHPQGLANRSDQVGRNYMAHNNSSLVAISVTPNPSQFQKTLGLADFYHRSDDWEYPLGLIQMLGKIDAEMILSEAPPLTPNFAAQQVAGHSLDFFLTTEDLPLSQNRVTLRADNQIQLSYTETNMASHLRLIAKLKDMLRHLGCNHDMLHNPIYFGKKIPIAGVAHQSGTLRFGTDPLTSVLDVNCKAHDLNNLYVVDSSFLPSSSAVNPSLTIMANALRVGDHLLQRLS